MIQGKTRSSRSKLSFFSRLPVQVRLQETTSCSISVAASSGSGFTEQRRRPQLSRLHDDTLPGLSEVRHQSSLFVSTGQNMLLPDVWSLMSSNTVRDVQASSFCIMSLLKELQQFINKLSSINFN